MKRKQNISAQQWTQFWNSLGIRVRKRARTLKSYKAKSDIASLRRAGVSNDAATRVYQRSLNYDDALVFKKFSKFFRKDVQTVQVWLKANDVSQAFTKLFNILNKGDLEQTKKKFLELSLIFEFYKKGEGQLFTGKYPPKTKLQDFRVRNLLQRLNRYDPNARYVNKGIAKLGKENIIWIEKRAENKITSKFIKLSRNNSELRVTLSMDSRKEYGVIRSVIEKHFNTYLDTPELKASFRRFTNFLESGRSKHFVLSGVTYVDSEFRLSIMPSQNRIVNVTALPVYQERITNTVKKIEAVSQLRLSHNERSIRKPIFISVLTYKEGIFGAVLFHLDDKKLTATQRSKLHADFKQDFSLPLNQFLLYDDLTNQSLYKYFLQTGELTSPKIQLRSKSALSVYQSLLQSGIITPSSSVEETSKVCVNSSCPNYFVRIWDNWKHCHHCHELLIPGKTIETHKINEIDIAKYLEGSIKFGNVNTLARKLLSRNLCVSQISYDGMSADVIPITASLNENQLEVVKIRYPHAILVTSKNDKPDLVSKGFEVLNLWELVHSLEHHSGKVLKEAIRTAADRALTRMRVLCDSAVNRISDKSYYKKLNRNVKNLGAEMFEADCSILFDYVFGNCIWLGAKHRGASLPDGITAFPMLQTNKGCFIWDSKFSEGRQLVMGQFNKNKKYIDSGKTNPTIKANGGLKGFTFVSNNNFPVNFAKKYASLTIGRRLKIAFVRATELQKIAKHYRKYEKLILNNSKARDQFINSMIDLLFTTAKGRSCEIISDAMVAQSIAAGTKFFKSLRAGRPLKA